MLSLRKPKEKVFIIAGNTVIKKKKCLVDGTKVIIDKGAKGKGNIGWKVNYKPTDFKYIKNRFFGTLKRHLEIKQDATNFIPFGEENVEVPSCTRSDIEHYGNAKIIEKSGISTQKLEVPIFVYIMLAAVLAIQIFQFLSSQGIVKP